MSEVPNAPDQPPNPAPQGGLAETVYAHLRAIAQQQMNAERAGHTLTATALVHEAYLRLGSDSAVRARGRGAYLHAAAEAMRRILIEHARARGRIKRGGGAPRVPLESIGDVADLDQVDLDRAETIFAFDEAFRRLEEQDPGAADVVRLRFFAGLSVPETATVLGISERTVNNYWAFARAWLARDLQNNSGPVPDGE